MSESWSAADSQVQELALDAVQSVTVEVPGGGREIDVKKYAKVGAHASPQLADHSFRT